MIEVTTNAQVRHGFEQAHKERAAAVRSAFLWLTGRG
jgi:hypothetical protein